eukprot:m.140010 g.140010  ORF g.140010 m.140010 type:complete len:516 (+) comp22773_c0_seq2:134-1681(+)
MNPGQYTMLGLTAILVSATVATSATGTAPQKPNFVFLLTDDWGWGDVGAYAKLVNSGDKPPLTPHLDRLATEGTIYTKFHTLASVCSPSRASWLVGSWPLAVKSPYIFSCTNAANAQIGQADFVNLSVPFIPKLLHNNGWRTAHYGKWHLGCTPDAPAVNEYGYDDSSTYVSNNKSAQLGNFSTDQWFPANSSTLIVNHALGFIKQAPAEPFYLNLWFHISHAPLNPSPEQLENFTVEEYCPWSGMSPLHVASNRVYERCPIQIFRASQHDADAQIGRLMDYIRSDDNLKTNTFVIMSGDNGPEDPHIYFNSVGSAGAFRGRKRSLYEGGISTPLITWWPGKIPAGRVSSGDIASIDWFPTVASFASIELDSPTRLWLQGHDVSAELTGKAQPTRTIPLTWDYRFRMPGHCYHQSPRLAILDPTGSGWKLLMNPDRSRLELYNITNEMFEATNLAAENPDVVDRLATMLLEWVAAMPKSPPSAIQLNAGCDHYTPTGEVTPIGDTFRGLSDYEIA